MKDTLRNLGFTLKGNAKSDWRAARPEARKPNRRPFQPPKEGMTATWYRVRAEEMEGETDLRNIQDVASTGLILLILK